VRGGNLLKRLSIPPPLILTFSPLKERGEGICDARRAVFFSYTNPRFRIMATGVGSRPRKAV
jgi:hypothetical protein